tara:strand:+ start:100512 stop:101399 length:888 start_codon:yes stop_codon:yes gene_type:complete
VVTIHDCAFHDCPDAFSKSFQRWYEWLLPRLACRAAKIITVSEFSRRRLLDLFGVPIEKTEVIANAVSQRFRPTNKDVVDAMRSRLGLPDSYVLTLGSIEPRKNLDRLLQAWKMSSERLKDRVLVVAGGRSSVFREVFTSAPRNVMFLGYVPDSDLPALYSGASCFVYTSVYEGFGLPVLEAMSCGTPVVCSNNTSLPEVSGEAAVAVDPFDVDVTGAAISEILQNPELQRTLRTDGLRQAARFSWTRTSDQVWDVLQSQVAERPVVSSAKRSATIGKMATRLDSAPRSTANSFR